MNAAAAKAIEVSSNAKTGPVSTTMASQASCDPTCPFRKSGCYAESGPQGIHTARLNKAEADHSPEAIAKAEAEAIDGLSGQRDLRLHVVGDCSTTATARIVAEAAERHTAKAGKSVWTYTHSWRTVERKAWGKVSVLASVETVDDARKAMARGFAAAMVVESFGTTKAAPLADDVKGIPCPAQTRDDVTCQRCQLCWKDGALLDRRAVILFAAHGSGQKKIRRALAGEAQS